ncbi:hypothetical protein Tco_1369747 [Tanacetum coccineum]
MSADRSGPTSYAKLVTGESSRKSVNFCTLTELVAITLESIRAISERFVNSAYGFFLGKWVAYPVVSNYVKYTWSKYGVVKSMLNSSNELFFFQFSFEDGLDAILENVRMVKLAKAMIDLRADEELKDSIVVDMPKLVGEGFNMCTIRVEYEWKAPRCSSYKVFGHVLNECPKKFISDVVKYLNNPRQATRGVPVGQKVSFKSTKEIYRLVSNKNDASTIGKKKQAEVSRHELDGKGSLNVAHGSSSNTPIIDKIDKLERQMLDGKLMFVSDDGNPLVPTGNVDSESEVEVVFDETANLMISTSFKGGSDKGYGTNSLFEQWRETKRDDDYNPYDDNFYDSHDMSDHLQAICDDLDITVYGRKKK